ncbi:hypothetical protein Acy02nite_61030 [Actinoplanes cyaneus]|uniref:Fibronectin type-III domain-containing protein n=1 Tax=Actinoplanes cyaneus TaxID=52696 RepID=A0A919IPU5_9ACTN|nr:tetratricopeptide repeat protein [Actinoplanes cyaneus]GID68222.1 hypothetical protein Acy02nite_61030 [Actinoplanes cyaneus]
MSHPSPLTPALERAHSLVAAGDLAGAAVLLERAIEIGQANLSQDHPDVLATQRELASLHHQAGNPAAAKLVLEEAHEAGQFSLGDDDPLMLQISYDLGVLAEELGHRDEARVAFGRVADFGPMMLGPGHWAVVRAQAYLGQDQTSAVRDEPARQMPQSGPAMPPPDNHPTILRPEPSVQLPPPPQITRPAAAQDAQAPEQPSPWQGIPAPRQGNPWAQGPGHPRGVTEPTTPSGQPIPARRLPEPPVLQPAESRATPRVGGDATRPAESRTTPQTGSQAVSEVSQRPEDREPPAGKKESGSPWGPAPWTAEEPAETPFQQLKPGVFGVPKAESGPALFHRGSNDAVVVQRPDPVVMPLRSEPLPAPEPRPDSITPDDPVPAQIKFPVWHEPAPEARPESVTPGVSAPAVPVSPARPQFPAIPVAPAREEPDPAELGPANVKPAEPQPAPELKPTPELTPAPEWEPAPEWKAAPKTTEPARDRVVEPPSWTHEPTPHPVDDATSQLPQVTAGPAGDEPFTAWPDFNRWPGEAADAPQSTVYFPEAGSGPQDVAPSSFQPTAHPGVYRQQDVHGQQDPVPSGFQRSTHLGVYEQQQPGVYHQGTDGTWQGGPAPAPAQEVAADALTTYGKSGNRKRGMALFAVIAATLAAVVAVAALVFTLARDTREGDEGDTAPGSPTLAGAPPGNVKLTDAGTKIDVTWSDPTDATVSFMVTMAHPGEQLKPVSTVGPGQTSRRIEGLSPSLDYCFAVVAVYATDKFATSPQVCTDRGKK